MTLETNDIYTKGIYYKDTDTTDKYQIKDEIVLTTKFLILHPP